MQTTLLRGGLVVEGANQKQKLGKQKAEIGTGGRLPVDGASVVGRGASVDGAAVEGR